MHFPVKYFYKQIFQFATQNYDYNDYLIWILSDI